MKILYKNFKLSAMKISEFGTKLSQSILQLNGDGILLRDELHTQEGISQLDVLASHCRWEVDAMLLPKPIILPVSFTSTNLA